jgi:hypothetical protein
MGNKVWVDGLAGLVLGVMLTFVMLGASVAQQAGLSAQENDTIQLEYYAQQVHAVKVEDDGWMWWGELPKEEWSQALEDSYQEYDAIKDKINQLVVSPEIQPTRQNLVDLIDKTKVIYQRLHTLSDEDMQQSFKEHAANVDQFNTMISENVKQYYQLSNIKV